jgi:methionine-rich copper-binding protein CopC
MDTARRADVETNGRTSRAKDAAMIPSNAPRAVPTPTAPTAARAGAALAALALAGLAPVPAAAHAVLVASVPTVGGSVDAGPVAITLRYNSHVDRGRSKITLLRSDSTAERLAVEAAGPPDQLAAAATLAPGAYTLRWQVLATDGHITRGDVAFTVILPAGATAPAPGAGPASARTAGN